MASAAEPVSAVRNLSDYEYSISDNKVTITGYVGSGDDITIPSLIEGYPVTGIGEDAFSGCESLTSVVIPDSVTSIGENAFYDCSGLTSVVIPGSVTNIGDFAFYDCSSLTDVVIPNSVTSIGDYAFSWCDDLTSVVIPDSVTRIGHGAFDGCSSLTSVVIPASVTSIGDYTFARCSGLTSVCFAGLPPELDGPDVFYDITVPACYISGMVGWGSTFGGLTTAVWTSAATFAGNGGTPSFGMQTYNAGKAYGELPTASRPGSTFTGWWTADVEGTQVTAETLVPLLTTGHTLYAQWNVLQYSVTFDLGELGTRTGAGELSQEVEHGSAAVAPEVLVENGWVLEGWDHNFEQVTGPLTIRAVYSYTYSLFAGWNCISINLNLTEESRQNLQMKGAMIQEPSSKVYAFSGNLAATQACWIYCQAADEITLLGTAVENFDFKASLKQGWNFVGPLTDLSWAGTGSVGWSWNGQRYYLTISLLAGHGYWLYWPGGQVAPAEDTYLIIDLQAGANASSYPVSTLATAPADGWTDEYKTTRMVMRRIPAGTFIMGSPTDELERNGDETQHQVTLTQSFYAGVFEVTQKQWELVMGNWPSGFSNADYRDARPVEQVSYDDIRGGNAGSGWPANNTVDTDSFMGRLRIKTGLILDLPTEAQWEYACRAGTTTALNSGKNLTSTKTCPNMAEVGRYWIKGVSSYSLGGDSSSGTAKVGSHLANQWGLYDMHGNVREWCQDWYAYDYSQEMQTDPKGAASASSRVYRGGGWYSPPAHCRSALRHGNSPSYRLYDLGFRLVRMVP